MTLAVYDMAEHPATYDIVPWLGVVAAIAGPRPVTIAVLADRFRNLSDKDRALSLGQKQARVRGIVVPCCSLLPGAKVLLVVNPDEADGWRRRLDTLKPATFVAESLRQHRAGRDVRRLRSHVTSLHPGAVVMTIRQSPAVPTKNSSLDEWLGAASVLMARGHEVVLIPDTSVANLPLPTGFTWCRHAALDVSARAALYQDALCSMSAGVGPMSIAMYMPATRYAVFVDHRGVPPAEHRPVFERTWGVRWGDQLPFAGRGQVIEYRHDDEDAILDTFRGLMVVASERAQVVHNQPRRRIA